MLSIKTTGILLKNIRIKQKAKSLVKTENVQKIIQNQLKIKNSEMDENNTDKIKSRKSLTQSSSNLKLNIKQNRLSIFSSINQKKQKLTIKKKSNQVLYVQKSVEINKDQMLNLNNQKQISNSQNYSKQYKRPNYARQRQSLKYREIFKEVENKQNFILKQQFNKIQNRKISFQKSSNLKKQFQLFQRRINNQTNFKYTIFNQFTIKVQPCHLSYGVKSQKTQNNANTKDMSVQSNLTSFQDKYFSQYARFRQLKKNSFQQVQNNVIKLQKIIQDAKIFKQNHQKLLEYTKQAPSNDRQRRVFGLSIELEEYSNKLKQSFSTLFELKDNIQKVQLKKAKKINTQLNNSLDLSTSLIRSVIIQLQNNTQFNKQKIQRILNRSLNKLNLIKQVPNNIFNVSQDIVNVYNTFISNVQNVHKQWSTLFFQNRVLLYNFMKQIQKIPKTCIQLFGFKQQKQQQMLSIQKILEQRFHEYLGTKCEECYIMKKRVKIIKNTNDQIRPILKSLEWLLRDGNKQRSCLSVI